MTFGSRRRLVVVVSLALAIGVLWPSPQALSERPPGGVGDGPTYALDDNADADGGGATYVLYVSVDPDGAAAVPLEGARVAGSATISVAPERKVREVAFYLDDPTMAGRPYRVDGSSPFELFLSPTEISTLGVGSHTLTAAIGLAGNGGLTSVATATFAALDATVLRPGDDVQGWLDSHPGGVVTLDGQFKGLQLDIRHPVTVNLAAGTVLDGQGTTTNVVIGTGADFSLVGVLGPNGERPVIRNYLARQQDGAIAGDDGLNWRIENVEVTRTRNNGFGQGAYGISIGDGMTVRNCKLTWNASLGIGGVGRSAMLIENNEIAWNNWESHHTEDSVRNLFVSLASNDNAAWLAEYHVSPSWEGGGTKFVGTDGLILRNNHVHHNGGWGLWTDINNINVLIEDNLSEWNAAIGISHELGYDAEIRNNVSRYNGISFDVWGWGAQIAVQNSNDTYVHDNQIVVSALGGNGLVSINQDRGGPNEWSPLQEPWESVRLRFIDNDVIYEGANGSSGIFDDTEDEASKQPGAQEWSGNSYTRP